MQKLAPWVVLAAVVGAIEFVMVQALGGFSPNIAQFMGRQIVNQGGYSQSLVGAIGWTIHLGVSLTYAALYFFLSHRPVMPVARITRWTAGLVLALVLGWLTTLATAPAIAVTISVLAGQGWPAALPGLNTSLGFAFWNHVGFFVICWALTLVWPDILRGERPEAVNA
jgi:hypothetical protein